MKCATCRHESDFHQHYRPGTECSICWCARFKPSIWRIVRDWLYRIAWGR